MENITQNNQSIRVASARESFSGRLLTDAQFDECMAITNIIGREIRKTGTFKDKLGDYSYAFARSEKFDAMKAETILRDLFKESTGQTMNQMREKLVKNAEAITDDQRQKAYQCACDISKIMESGKKLSFHRTWAEQAQSLAKEFGVTDSDAKRLMSDEFNAAEGAKLFEWGKELDEKIYRPQIESERQNRAADRSQTRTRNPSSTRSGPSHG